VVIPVVEAYIPAEQSRQNYAADCGKYWPVGHDVQLEAAPVLYVPERQERHAVADDDAE
jgi:hypothetical protein